MTSSSKQQGVIETRFSEELKFSGAWFPKHDDMPEGPKTQSFVLCVCGKYWKNHRFIDGACPQ